MNLLKVALLFILTNYVCFNAADSSDEENEAIIIQKVIVPIDIEFCEGFANAIRNDFDRDYFEDLDEEENRFNQLQTYPFGNSTPRRTITPESEVDRTLRIERENERSAKLEKKFIQDEIDIRDRALSVLVQYPEWQKKYMRLIRNEKLYPSIAILELTKDINAVPRALALLELVEHYDYFEYEGYFHDRSVELEASCRIFNYYLDEYNKRAAALLNPKQMDRSLHDLLQLCQKHTPTHPMSGIDDHEYTLHHISAEVNKQLLTMNLWYINNPKLIQEIVNMWSMQRFFALGTRFLQCTTYGIAPYYFDLGYLLKQKKFVGIKMPLLNNHSEFQHIWIHPYWPLQVRITQNGKVTVGLLKENPLTSDKKLTHNSIKVENELLKISLPSLSGHLIPARHIGEQYQKLWVDELESDFKNYLMGEAHAHLDARDMNFTRMETALCQGSDETTLTKKTQGHKAKKFKK
jgi:hypothetical protein